MAACIIGTNVELPEGRKLLFGICFQCPHSSALNSAWVTEFRTLVGSPLRGRSALECRRPTSGLGKLLSSPKRETLMAFSLFTRSCAFFTIPTVTVNPPGGAHLDLQVENIFVNPSMLPPGSEFLEDMAVSDPSIGIVNSEQVVAENAPEPSTLPLTGLAMGALTWLWRCRWRSRGPSAPGYLRERGARALS